MRVSAGRAPMTDLLEIMPTNEQKRPTNAQKRAPMTDLLEIMLYAVCGVELHRLLDSLVCEVLDRHLFNVRVWFREV